MESLTDSSPLFQAAMNPYWFQVRSILSANVREQQRRTLAEREAFCQRYAWAIPDPGSLAFVAAALGEKAVEMGAGTGYWAQQLKLRGVQVDAYDVRPPEQTFYPVQVGFPDVLERYTCPLLLSWPPHNDPMAADCLLYYKGDRLVYIGYIGPGNGVNADDTFWRRIRRSWRPVAERQIVQWLGCQDRIVVYERVKHA